MDNPPGTIPVHGTTVENCVVEYFTYGIYIYGSTNTTVQDCELKNLRNEGWTCCGGNGIQAWTDNGPGHDYNTGTQILNNSIHDNPREGVAVGSWDPTVIPDFSGMVISGNEIYDNAAHGLNLMFADFSSDNLSITENDIYGNEYGIGLGPYLSGLEAHSNNIYDNTTWGAYQWWPLDSSMDATCNWWGDAGGPGVDGANGVSGDVDVSTWLDGPYPGGNCIPEPGTMCLLGLGGIGLLLRRRRRT